MHGKCDARIYAGGMILTINAVAGNRFAMAGWTQPGRGQERRGDAAANPCS